jgi:DNA-binding transcriptional LysR family regulator
MRRLCPSIQELQAFEAAARHMSITRAATELCVTQGAVSRQILSLEAWLEVRLFERVKQRLILTQPGRTYLAQVRPSLLALESATVELRTSATAAGLFHLACVPTFGAKWLIPRLPDFKRQHPDITVSFVPYVQGAEFVMGGSIDAAIRFGEGIWPNAQADYLTGRELLAVAAPSMAQKIQGAQDVAKCPLLHHSSVPHAWEDWRMAAGIADMESYAGARFDQFSLLIEAVIAELGVALVPACLISEELGSGKMQAISGNTIEGWKGYYLCYPEERQHLPALLAFRAWLLRQANESHELKRIRVHNARKSRRV